jgi:hypothetical protein
VSGPHEPRQESRALDTPLKAMSRWERVYVVLAGVGCVLGAIFALVQASATTHRLADGFVSVALLGSVVVLVRVRRRS